MSYNAAPSGSEPEPALVLESAWNVVAVRAAEDRVASHPAGPDLMARAATGLFHRCLRLLKWRRGVYGARVVMLVGRGNNGGDTLFAGARLAARGCSVTAIVAADDVGQAHRPGLDALRAERGRAMSAALPTVTGELIAGAHLILDGLVGIGGRGALREPAAGLARAARAAHERGALVVAVDLPSGVDADTGEVPDPD
ncbi:MAG: NAD(P)H-hydrate epimerase, partial [Mycobacteriales bacterium]